MVASIAPDEAFAKAVAIIGTQTATARELDVTQGAIWQRLRAKKPAAPEWVLKLEAATGISRHDLRPDLYPREVEPAPAASGSEIAR